MAYKKSVNKTLFYLLALALIVVLSMVFFGNGIHFAPKNSDANIVGASADGRFDIFGLDEKMEKKELEVAYAFRDAVREAQG